MTCKASHTKASQPVDAGYVMQCGMVSMPPVGANVHRGTVCVCVCVCTGVLQQLVDGGGSGSGSMQVQVTLRMVRGVGVTLLAGCGFVTPEEATVLAKLGMGWRAVPK